VSDTAARLAGFIGAELSSLHKLRDALTGAAPIDDAAFEALICGCDYLWAHFPDCAGRADGRPPTGELSFLKRVRGELDYFIGLFEIAGRRCQTLLRGTGARALFRARD
jgi:hypothetical protein